MISDNDSCNNASVSAISECGSGSVKQRLRNTTATSIQQFGQATTLLAHRHGRRRLGPVQGAGDTIGVSPRRGAGTNKPDASDPYGRLRPQTRGTTQQQQLLLAHQLPQVSITLIKTPRTENEQPGVESGHKRPAASTPRRTHQTAVPMPTETHFKPQLNHATSASSGVAASKKQTQAVQQQSSTPQRNFMSNLPYMGELTFDSRPRRGRKPKKADICHLISKNYGIQFPKSASPSTLPPLPLLLPVPCPKKRKPQPSYSTEGPGIMHEFYSPAASARVSNLYTSQGASLSSSAPPSPSLVTLQKLYQEKFSAFGQGGNPSHVFIDSTTESQPLNLCTRDVEAEDDEEDEDETEHNNNNHIRSWLGSCVEDACYDKKYKRSKPKTVITVVQKNTNAATAEQNYTDEDVEDESQSHADGSGDEGDNGGQEEKAMLIDDDQDVMVEKVSASQPTKFRSFLVKNHFLCNSDDDGVDVDDDVDLEVKKGAAAAAVDHIGEENPDKTKRRRANARPQPSQERSLALLNPSEPNTHSVPDQQWAYHHHQLLPARTAKAIGKSKSGGSQRHRNSRPRTRDRSRTANKSIQASSSAPTNAAAAVSAAVRACNNAQVSICKFKFTGGVKPTLQEKKMLSLDSGGNFRFYSDKPLQPPVSGAGGGLAFAGDSAARQQHFAGAGSGNNRKSSSQHKNAMNQKGKTDGGKVGNCGNVTTTTSLRDLPPSAKSMSMCMLPTGSSASPSPSSVSVPIPSTSASAFSKSLISPMILPDITISACPTNNSSCQPDQDADCSTKNSSCCNSRSSCCSSSRASSPGGSGSGRSLYSRSDSEAEDGECSNNSLLQVPTFIQQASASALSLTSSAARRPGSSSSAAPLSRRSPTQAGSHARSHSSSSNNSRRRTKKSVARENLEKTFKEKGFLIQTQQLESSEGVTYCKFRQLKKFTRYLFRSWKDYLPEAVKDSIVISGSGVGGAGRQGGVIKQEAEEDGVHVTDEEIEPDGDQGEILDDV